jgi:hypothetical protein
MATVTGELKDFGMEDLSSLAPVVTFTPSTVGVLSSELFATRPIKVVPADDGSFSVELQATEELQNVVFYSLSISWLNSSGGFLSVDLPDWKIRVPGDGGAIGDLISAPTNPALTFVNETAPLNPSVGQLWLVPSTGDLYRWEI